MFAIANLRNNLRKMIIYRNKKNESIHLLFIRTTRYVLAFVSYLLVYEPLNLNISAHIARCRDKQIDRELLMPVRLPPSSQLSPSPESLLQQNKKIIIWFLGKSIHWLPSPWKYDNFVNVLHDLFYSVFFSIPQSVCSRGKLISGHASW